MKDLKITKNILSTMHLDVPLIKNTKKMSNIVALLISFFLIYIFLNRLFEFPYNNKVTAVISLIILLLTLLTVFPKITISQIILFIFIILISIPVAKSNNRLWYLFYRLYWTVTTFSLGLIMVHTTPRRYILSIPFYVLAITYIVIVFFFNYAMVIPIGDQRLLLFNRNSVAMFAFTFASVPMVFTAIKKAPVGFSEIFNLALLIFVQSLTRSRAGILISILYSSFVIVYLLKNSSKPLNHWFIGSTKKIVQLLPYILGVVSIGVLITIVILNSRLVKNGLSSNGRIAIYKSFFDEVTFSRLIKGFFPTIYRETHMHNSFLELLVTSGLVGSLPVFVSMAISFFKLLKKSLLLLGIYILIILYSMIEYYFFFLQGDFLLIPIIIFALFPSEIKTETSLPISSSHKT